MSAAPLDDRLRWVRRATLGRTLAAHVSRGVAAAIVFTLALVALDAFRPMPPWARAALSCLWIVGLALGIIRSFRLALRSAPNLNATARLVERRAAVPHNRIINARFFARAATEPSDALAPALTARAIDLGRDSLRGANEQAILAPERALARRSIARLLTIAIILAASFFAMPRVFDAVLPRFAEPFADHPAYSPTEFRLTFDPSAPSQGDDVLVKVETTGAQPRSLRLVVREPLAPSRSVPLVPSDSDPSERSAQLHNIRSTILVHAEGDTGRSRAVEIIPLTIPRITEAAATITPPRYSGRPAVTHALRPGSINRLGPLVGSQIDLHIGATIRLREGGVTIHPSSTLTAPKFTATGKSLRAVVGPIESHALEIDARPISVHGVACDEGVRVAIDPAPDAPPTLELVMPVWSGEDLLAPAHATLVFSAEAGDDLGLQVLGLAYSLFDARGVWRSFGTIMHARHDESPLLCAPSEVVEVEPRLPLARLGAEPGGSLIISMLALDSRVPPFGQPQRASVGPIVVRLATSGEGGSCGGRCDGWIQLPGESAGRPSDSEEEAPSDTWSSDAQANPESARGDRGRRSLSAASDQTDTSGDSQSNEAELTVTDPEEVSLADPILMPADAPRRATPGGRRDAGRGQRSATETPPDRRGQVPDAYRDVVTRYFQLLNEASNSKPGSP